MSTQSRRETRRPPRAEKVCATCGRSFAWRKAWEHVWDDVRYCSAACRRQKPGFIDRRLEAEIRDLLSRRSGSICPSEAARRVGGADWRPLMEPTRRAARRLAAAGEVEITQSGVPIDPSRAAGPIRIRRIETRGRGR